MDKFTQIPNLIEYTNLSHTITSSDIDAMVADTLKWGFFGICIPPYWVKKTKRDLAYSSTKVITVVGFPFGYHITEVKLTELKTAIDHGADEIDWVMNLSALKSGAALDWIKPEIARAAKICHENEVILKLIVEAWALEKSELILACKIGADAGIDFVKTSTGINAPATSPEIVAFIKSNVPTGVGVKASGGIRDLTQTKALITAGADRIGTSKAIDIVKQWKNESVKS